MDDLDVLRAKFSDLASQSVGRKRSHTIVSGGAVGKGPDAGKQLEATQQILKQREADLQLSIELGQTLLARVQEAEDGHLQAYEELERTTSVLHETQSELAQVKDDLAKSVRSLERSREKTEQQELLLLSLQTELEQAKKSASQKVIESTAKSRQMDSALEEREELTRRIDLLETELTQRKDSELTLKIKFGELQRHMGTSSAACLHDC